MKQETVRSHRTTAPAPFCTLFLTIISLLLYLADNIAGSFFQYDRYLIADGELWRIITGHWTHWSFDHFLWSTITFLLLGSICERLNRTIFLATLLIASGLIGAASWFAAPHILFYRGLSGIGSSLFLFAATLTARNGYLKNDRLQLLLSLGAGAAFGCKVLFEYVSGQALFVTSSAIFTPMVLAHLVGGGVGLLMAWKYRNLVRTGAVI